MLDIQTYRLFEELARSSMGHWMTGHRHMCKGSFPLTLLSQTRVVIDGMQEFRFEDFQSELGGYTPLDLERFIAVAKDALIFQELHFPGLPYIVPFNALLSAQLVCKKIHALKPGFENLLELGPGSGYQAFFLRHFHPSLTLYTQVESNDAFYLFQHLINEHVFGMEFEERVYPDRNTFAQFFEGERHGVATYLSSRADISPIGLSRPRKRLVHYPWWRIGEIFSADTRYDVIMSNANLVEFSPVAMDDYLKVIHTVLAADGVLYIQDFGGGPRGGPEGIPEALDHLYAAGFAPLFLALSAQTKGDPRWASDSNYLQINAQDRRCFRLPNAVFIKEGHELFSRCYKRENLRDYFFAPYAGLKEAFFSTDSRARVYTRHEISEILKEEWARIDAVV